MYRTSSLKFMKKAKKVSSQEAAEEPKEPDQETTEEHKEPDEETAEEHKEPDEETTEVQPLEVDTPEPEDNPVPWPAPGVRVAVGVEDLMHSLRFGGKGESQGRPPEDSTSVIVTLDAGKALSTLRIPCRLLVPEGGRPRTMKMWDKASDEVLRGLLWSTGIQDPRVEALKSTPSVSLTMWTEWLRYGLSTGEDKLSHLSFIPPALVRAVHEGREKLVSIHAETRDVPFAEVVTVVVVVMVVII